MNIPNADRAFIDIKKLEDYCLNTDHPRGKHKARLFAEVLGLTAKDAEGLKRVLSKVVRTQDAVAAGQDQYGRRYIIDFTMRTAKGQAKVRSSWIILSREDFPRLISCYVLKKRRVK